MKPTTGLNTVAAILFVVGLGCGDDGSGADDTDSTGASSSGGEQTSGSSATTEGATSTNSGTSSSGATNGSSDPATSATSDPASSGSGASETSSSDTAQTCPDVGDPCTICESSQCAADYCGCFNNGSCLLLAQCAALCELGDAECNQACWTQYPEGISDGALLTDCAATTCAAECGPYIPLSPCQLCLYGECPEEMNVCVSNPECTALLECLDACETPGCESTCYTAHPDGLADSGPVGRCGQDACTQECA